MAAWTPDTHLKQPSGDTMRAYPHRSPVWMCLLCLLCVRWRFKTDANGQIVRDSKTGNPVVSLDHRGEAATSVRGRAPP